MVKYYQFNDDNTQETNERKIKLTAKWKSFILKSNMCPILKMIYLYRY